MRLRQGPREWFPGSPGAVLDGSENISENTAYSHFGPTYVNERTNQPANKHDGSQYLLAQLIITTIITAHTEKVPFATDLVGGYVNCVRLGCKVNLCSVVRPRAELHGALLVVERKPLYVNGAG